MCTDNPFRKNTSNDLLMTFACAKPILLLRLPSCNPVSDESVELLGASAHCFRRSAARMTWSESLVFVARDAVMFPTFILACSDLAPSRHSQFGALEEEFIQKEQEQQLESEGEVEE